MRRPSSVKRRQKRAREATLRRDRKKGTIKRRTQAAIKEVMAEYDKLHAYATQKGWKLPPENGGLPDIAWINYWKQMQAYELDPEGGRPIPPHRSGGGIPMTELQQLLLEDLNL